MIRVSFGTALIASIVIVYTTIIALLTSSRRYSITLMSTIVVFLEKFSDVNEGIMLFIYSDDDNRGRRGGRSYDSGVTFYFNPVDLFW